MARGKKKEKMLTPEEKLQEALVPESEQPYKVPENWRWVLLSKVVDLFNGDRGANYPSKKDYVVSGIPFINAGAIQGGKLDPSEYNYITQSKYDALRAGKVQKGDILYCLRGSLGKTAIVDFDNQGAISSSLCILRIKNSILREYLYYLLNSNVVEHQQNSAENGSAQPNLSAVSVLNYKLPLPPLPEQKRIVDRIESLFAKLDEAKEKTQAVVDGFEDRKAAILHKAFTGELTERWRKIHHISLDSWRKTQLKEIVTGFKYGSSEKSDYNNTGLPVLRIPNIGDGDINFNDMKFFSDIKTESSYYVHENDILIIRSNGSRDLVGKCALVPTLDKEYAYASFLIKILPSDMVRPGYLVMYLNSSDARRQMFAKAKSSAGIHNINSKELGAISLSLPYIDEQFEIIRRASGLLRKEQQAKDSAEQVIVQIDTMKKSILARAFRGELGTNDPSDESAEELLKRIM